MTDTLSKAAVSFERIGELLQLERQVRDLPARGRHRRCGTRSSSRTSASATRRTAGPARRQPSTVEPGQRAALVGPTGSGKSTLIGLIPRLYDVDRRADPDRRARRSRATRCNRCAAGQFRAAGYGAVPRHRRAEHRLRQARRHARGDRARGEAGQRATNSSRAMPNGYDTMVGERGDTLSGGQRQRIAIARAIIRDTPILLLDEPSAALDPESEELIFEALTRLMAGRTSITIAHRLATVRRADVIFVLDDGAIAERGTHAELLAAGGMYARLFRLQFHPEDAEVPAIEEDAARPRAS